MNNDSQRTLDAQQPSVTDDVTTPKSRRKTSRVALLWLTLLTGVFIALSNIGFRLYQQMNHTTHELSLQLSILQQNQDTTQQTFQTSQKTMQINEMDLRSTLEVLQRQIKKATTSSTHVTHDWFLLKARYAIELAQLNAAWGHDRETTIALLEQADYFLEKDNTPQLFATRQTLAHDILAQKAHPKLDEAGLLSQLDAIQQHLTTCPIVSPNLPKPQNTISTSATSFEKIQSWQERAHAALHFLKQFFIVRHHDDPLQPLITPTYVALQREAIRLSLQEAEWAVLQHNDAVYQFMIQQTMDNIRRTFGKDNPEIQLTLTQLKQLQAVHVQETKQIPLVSLAPLDQAIQQYHEITTPALSTTLPTLPAEQSLPSPREPQGVKP